MAFVVSIIPQPVVAMPLIQPTRMIDDWIKTNAFELDALLGGRQRLAAYITQPTRPPIILDSSFGDKERPAIAFVEFNDHIAKGTITRMVRIDECRTQNPLIMNVVVAADNIEIFFRPAKLWSNPTADHVPGLELRKPVIVCGFHQFLIAGIEGQHINHWFDLSNPRPWINFPESLGGGNCGAHELLF